MATKAQIKNEINSKIISNGNIRATDTNRILNNILDCEELNDKGSGGNIAPFHFWSPDPLQDKKGAKLWYSFKGFHELLVNFTFRIMIEESNVNSLSFVAEKQSEIFKVFSKISNPEINKRMDFLVKIENNDPKVIERFKKKFRVGEMSFSTNVNEFLIQIVSQELDDSLFSGDEIFTSITFHCPDFNVKP
jgi:hypothetical protein